MITVTRAISSQYVAQGVSHSQVTTDVHFHCIQVCEVIEMKLKGHPLMNVLELSLLLALASQASS